MKYSAERLSAEIKRLEKEGRKGVRRIIDADPEHNEKALRLMEAADSQQGITYKDFSLLAKKRGWTAEMLAELFKGKTGIEDRSDKYREPLVSYFECVLSCQWLNPETRRMEDRRNVVIAYRSIVQFYLKELREGVDDVASTIQTGEPCSNCGVDNWIVRRGYNRCACGQCLWIERREGLLDSDEYRYVQGAALPSGYPGWAKVTEGRGAPQNRPDLLRSPDKLSGSTRDDGGKTGEGPP